MERPPNPWRLLPFSRLPAGEQMARADAMLAAVSHPALRWRQIVPEALVLGHGQPLASVDLHACHAAGCEVYRRATGGTAVFSGPELLGLDIVLPAEHPLALPDVTRSYAWLGESLAAGLRSLGIEAATVPPEAARALTRALAPGDPLRLACYATLSPHEVVCGGRKVVGLAQARRRVGVLLQAGILLGWRPQRLVSLLSIEPARREEVAAALRVRAVGLDELLGRIHLQEVVQRLTDAIRSPAGAGFVKTDWSPGEQAAIEAARPHFAALA